MMPIRIASTHPTVRFAARELSRHLKKTGASAAATTFRLGLCGDVGINAPADLRDDEDWICLAPGAGEIVLCGSNPRSVLFAVYRYLRAVGFRWIRPGKRGEIVPYLDELPAVPPLRERPSYHFRSICIEGTCSFEHVRDLIDWQARHGLNGYFIQFEYGTHFWKRWYEHADNPRRRTQQLDDAKIKSIVAAIIGEIEKRGLRFERVGHGWTCLPMGVAGEGWKPLDGDIAPDKKTLLAQIGGSRELFGGSPLNTNLCYSNPEARESVTDHIACYASTHPEISELHFWLADGMNNHCECENCRKARPADFYVEMLNRLDEKLTAQRLDTKIVFLIYEDLMWPPQRARLQNPDRFILMFAPITRTYSQSLADAPDVGETMRPYRRNRLQMPVSARANLEYLRAWQKLFAGECFDFDYHLIWACYYDLNQYALAEVLHQDIGALEGLGMSGLNSVMNQRISFPHNLLLDVKAHALWNKSTPFAAIAHESFSDAFGAYGAHVQTFFACMSKWWQPLFEPLFLTAPDEKRVARAIAGLTRMRAAVREFETVVHHARPGLPTAIQDSWSYLEKYLAMQPLLLDAFEAYARRAPQCRQKFEELFDWLWRHEPSLHAVLDVSTLVTVLKWRVKEAESTEAESTKAPQLAGGV